jgi:hypothetical protein
LADGIPLNVTALGAPRSATTEHPGLLSFRGHLFLRCPRPTATETTIQTVTATLEAPASYPPQALSAVRSAAAGMLVVTAIGAPTFGAMLQRAVTFSGLVACDAVVGDPLDVLTSPLRLVVGTGATRYYAGAVVGNVLVFWPAVAAVAGALATVVWHRTTPRGPRWRRALGSLRLPGVLLCAYLPLMQPTVVSSVVLLRDPAGGAAAALGIVGVAVVALPVLGCIAVVGPLFAARPRAAPSRGGGWCTSVDATVARLVDPPVSYGDDGTHFAAMYGFLFEDYRGGCHWYIAVELVSQLVLGVIAGFVPSYAQQERTSCATLYIAMTAVVVGMVAAMLAVRPYTVALTAALSWADSLCVLVGCVLLCVYGTGAVADAMSAVVMWVAVLVGVEPLLLRLLGLRPWKVLCHVWSVVRGGARENISRLRGLSLRSMQRAACAPPAAPTAPPRPVR